MKVDNRYRPSYHASVPEAWSNDPNGMIYYDGQVHLFFQHYPHEPQWGPMHWGHFTSKDFIKWEVHPVALVPDQDYEVICGCCSGNAFVKDGKLWLMYTAAQPELQRQCLAYSEDGIHFHKYEGNPVLTSDMLDEEVSPRDFRDPKIIEKDGWYYCLAGTRIIDPVLYQMRADRLAREAELEEQDADQTKDPAASVSASSQKGSFPVFESAGSQLEESGQEEDQADSVHMDLDVNPSRGSHDPSAANPLPSRIPVLGGDDRGALGNGNMILFRTKDFVHYEYCGKLFEKQEEFDGAFFELDGVYECPDYFVSNGTEIIFASPQKLPQMGHRFQNLHSVIYMTGHLNFETGHFEIESIEDLDSGFDIYASQAVAMPDGRHVMIAWKEMWDRPYPTRDHNWVGTYTLPRELSYEKGRLYQRPVREIENYRSGHVETGRHILGKKGNPEGTEAGSDMDQAGLMTTPDLEIGLDGNILKVEGFGGNRIEIIASFDPGTAERVGLKLFTGQKHETLVYYDAAEAAVVFDRSNSGIPLKAEGDRVRHCDIEKEDTIRFRIFLDVSSVEIFINDGRYVMTSNVYPDPEDLDVVFFAEGGQAVLLGAEKYDIDVK